MVESDGLFRCGRFLGCLLASAACRAVGCLRTISVAIAKRTHPALALQELLHRAGCRLPVALWAWSGSPTNSHHYAPLTFPRRNFYTVLFGVSRALGVLSQG